jgi:hypothetical protein
VTTVLEPTGQTELLVAEYGERGGVHFLDQPAIYRNHRAGFHREAQLIEAMTREERLNAALALIADAAALARRYEWFTRRTHPLFTDITDADRWVRETPLFRGLVSALPRKRKPMIELDDRARHAAGCPAAGSGACDCEPRPATDRAVLAVVMAAARSEAS